MFLDRLMTDLLFFCCLGNYGRSRKKLDVMYSILIENSAKMIENVLLIWKNYLWSLLMHKRASAHLISVTALSRSA